jgi:phosphoglycolate phosphatase-like HAD superfamily hydrolase
MAGRSAPGVRPGPGEAVILDVDGTLVDTNYQHALAWFRAFRRHGFVLPVWRIHRHMGMGGDQLVPAMIGEKAAQEVSDALRADEGELYGELIGEVAPFEGARELLAGLHAAGVPTVLASSAKPPELEHYLDLLDARGVVDAWTDASDVAATKPHPDLIEAALAKVGSPGAAGGRARRGILVGDSVYDCEAAARAGLPTIGLLTGGFSREELLAAGAASVCGSIGELRKELLGS